jgi:hypothetical protein
MFSAGLKMLCFGWYITSSFSNTDSLWILHAAIVRLKLEYASAVWNLIASMDAQKKFSAMF